MRKLAISALNLLGVRVDIDLNEKNFVARDERERFYSLWRREGTSKKLCNDKYIYYFETIIR